MNDDPLSTKCCVVGGGPAGIMLGYLLARAGIEVIVLEKHKDFFRDFRGDTVHPSTLDVMDELGLAEDFLRLPHQEVTSVAVKFGDRFFQMANLKGIRSKFPFVALMPQWDFLDFLSQQAKTFPKFQLLMEHEATTLIWRNDRENIDRVVGVSAQTPNGKQQIKAELVIACDGRHSKLRSAASLPVKQLGVPIDVLWFRIARKPGDTVRQVTGIINYGSALIMLDRDDYFQCGLIIRKGSFDALKQRGLAAFQTTLQEMVPMLQERFEAVKDWDDIKLLTVQINRLRKWHLPGLLCIGDAAHAMSPAFGVGINLAIQDAVATARILSPTLKAGGNLSADLAEVQERRQLATALTQQLQVMAHKGLEYVFRHSGPMHPPLAFRMATRIPGTQRLVGQVIGIGVLPEHVDRSRPSGLLGSAVLYGALSLAVGACLGFLLLRKRRAAIRHPL